MDESLRRFVKYVWWKSPDEALRYPERLIARVMDRGTTEDVFALMECVGRDRMRHVLENAEVGEFDAKSWAYWHYMLMDIPLGHVPPMPTRRLP